MVQNGPIRKVITIKVLFEYLFIFSPAVGHSGWTLGKFSEDFFQKNIMVRLSRLVFQIYLILHTPKVFDPLDSFWLIQPQ